MDTHHLDDHPQRSNRRTVGIALCCTLPLLLVLFAAAVGVNDRYRAFKAPGVDALPLPPGVKVAGESESCGSGGCPIREVRLTSEVDAKAPDVTAAVSAELTSRGWVEERTGGESSLFRSPDGDVIADLLPTRGASPGEREPSIEGEEGQLVVWLSYSDMGVGRWS